MSVLKDTLYDMARALVEHPDAVTVTEESDDDTITLTLSVDGDDMGMIIGKNGKIAKAIRTVIKAIAVTNEISQKVNVDIR